MFSKTLPKSTGTTSCNIPNSFADIYEYSKPRVGEVAPAEAQAPSAIDVPRLCILCSFFISTCTFFSKLIFRIFLFRGGNMSAEGADPVQMAIVELLGMSDMYRR